MQEHKILKLTSFKLKLPRFRVKINVMEFVKIVPEKTQVNRLFVTLFTFIK